MKEADYSILNGCKKKTRGMKYYLKIDMAIHGGYTLTWYCLSTFKYHSGKMK